jgi:hypothetical protein
MKRLFQFVVCLMAATAVWAQETTVNVETPGTLGQQLGSGRMSIASLKVTGTLNGTDVKVLRAMAGGSETGSGSGGALSELDLSEAVLVKGGDCYLRVRDGYDAYTENDVVSSKMFYGCGALRRVVIPNTVRRIYNDSFSACPHLEAIETADNRTFTSIDGVLYRADSTLVYRCPQGLHPQVVSLREGVKQIYPSAYRGIGSITELQLPSTIQGINDMAFFGCPNIRTIRFAAPNPPAMENAFDASVVANARLIVPRGSAERYRSKNGWKEFKNITEE